MTHTDYPDLVETLYVLLLTAPPNRRHDLWYAVRERLERMPVTLINDAVLTRDEMASEAMTRR